GKKRGTQIAASGERGKVESREQRNCANARRVADYIKPRAPLPPPGYSLRPASDVRYPRRLVAPSHHASPAISQPSPAHRSFATRTRSRALALASPPRRCGGPSNCFVPRELTIAELTKRPPTTVFQRVPRQTRRALMRPRYAGPCGGPPANDTEDLEAYPSPHTPPLSHPRSQEICTTAYSKFDRQASRCRCPPEHRRHQPLCRSRFVHQPPVLRLMLPLRPGTRTASCRAALSRFPQTRATRAHCVPPPCRHSRSSLVTRPFSQPSGKWIAYLPVPPRTWLDIVHYRPAPFSETVSRSRAWQTYSGAPTRHPVLSRAPAPPTHGHLGRQRPYARLARRYYWPSGHIGLSTQTCASVKFVQQCKVQQLAQQQLLTHGPSHLSGLRFTFHPLHAPPAQARPFFLSAATRRLGSHRNAEAALIAARRCGPHRLAYAHGTMSASAPPSHCPLATRPARQAHLHSHGGCSSPTMTKCGDARLLFPGPRHAPLWTTIRGRAQFSQGARLPVSQ
ncbi:unnamed protein product, partial [Trichogramma brassicae]